MQCMALAGHSTKAAISRKGWWNSTAKGLKPDLGVAAPLPHLNSAGSFVLEEKAPFRSHHRLFQEREGVPWMLGREERRHR